MFVSHHLHPVYSSRANFPTAVLLFLRALGPIACWNQSMTVPKWVRTSIKMWLSFDIVHTIAVTRFLSQYPSVAGSSIWTAVHSFLRLKEKKSKTSREWRKVDQRVYFHPSAQNLSVFSPRVAEWGHVLPKCYLRWSCPSPILLFSLSPRILPRCQNQPNWSLLPKTGAITHFLLYLCPLQAISVPATCRWFPAYTCIQASFKWLVL